MIIRCIGVVTILMWGLVGVGQGVRFGSSDARMTTAFEWAKGQALHYRGMPGDPVGPWYESALPPRDAFCMRDLSHQCVGGAILGLDAENKNMLTLFARNVSAAKNWCSYWEMDKQGGPSPSDYRSDAEFWYNLDANFDMLSATWRLAAWTGDSSYLGDAVFRNFQEKTVGPYIDSWVLAADSLLKRPAHPNAPTPYKESDAFDRCRGLPSYSEGISNMKVGVDLVAALYRGLMTYADILRSRGQMAEAVVFEQKAERYRVRLESDWWNFSLRRYNTWYSNSGRFGMGEGETFLLWFDALKDTARMRRTLDHLVSEEWNMENRSYFPFLFYREGYWKEARKVVLYLADPRTPRREYPEVSFGVVQGIVMGLMGVEVEGGARPGGRTLSTLYRSSAVGEAWLEDLPVLGTRVSVRHVLKGAGDPAGHSVGIPAGHSGKVRSILSNTGPRDIVWRAKFAGSYGHATVGGREVPMQQERTIWGKVVSFVDMPVVAGGNETVVAF